MFDYLSFAPMKEFYAVPTVHSRKLKASAWVRQERDTILRLATRFDLSRLGQRKPLNGRIELGEAGVVASLAQSKAARGHNNENFASA